MRILALIVTLLSLASATAQVFTLPANGTWTKVQSGEVIQWSASPAAHPQTRIDLESYVENGNRTTYYLVRSACPNNADRVASYMIKPGNKLGIGMDCNGKDILGTSAVLNEVRQLPAEAAALLK